MNTTSETKMTKEVVEIAPEILVLEKKVTKSEHSFFGRLERYPPQIRL